MFRGASDLEPLTDLPAPHRNRTSFPVSRAAARGFRVDCVAALRGSHPAASESPPFRDDRLMTISADLGSLIPQLPLTSSMSVLGQGTFAPLALSSTGLGDLTDSSWGASWVQASDDEEGGDSADDDDEDDGFDDDDDLGIDDDGLAPAELEDFDEEDFDDDFDDDFEEEPDDFDDDGLGGDDADDIGDEEDDEEFDIEGVPPPGDLPEEDID
jgi:hypothetical protein